MTPEQLQQAETTYRTAWRQFQQARAERHKVIRQAAKEGMSTRQIAGLLGLSFQRIAQITRR